MSCEYFNILRKFFEFEVLFLVYRIRNAASRGFIEHPPCITNTNCRTAAFEFVPFKFGDSIPELAIGMNDESGAYIGRCLNSVEDYELCKIMPKSMEIQAIKYGDILGKDVVGYEVKYTTFIVAIKFRINVKYLQILVGKGLKWISDKRNREEDFFQFRHHLLIKNANEDLSLVGLRHVGKYLLAYDDNTLASSFEDDVGSGIFYCH